MAAQAGFEGLAILQQLRIEAQAGVDEEHLAVDEPDLHRLRPRLEQRSRRGLRVERDAVLARQVIERALRNHRQRAAMVQRSLGPPC